MTSNNYRLANKVALITGAGAGIGAAVSTLFAREGAAILMVDADAQALARTKAAILNAQPDARVFDMLADVTNEEAAMASARYCVDAWGSLDVLVNNAAMRNYSAAADATPGE